MAGHSPTVDSKTLWGGGISPFNISYGKIMMWFFLVSDAFTFSSLLVAYGAIRFSKGGDWPMPDMVFNHFPGLHGIHLPLMFVSLMTLILILSSVTMVLAVEAGHRMDKKAVIKYMLLTIIGGVMFLSCQAWEWSNFIGDGASLSQNNFELTDAGIAKAEALSLGDHYHWEDADRTFGQPPFSALFFMVTGFHGFHVFSGVVLLIIVFINSLFGTYERRGHYEMVEKVGLYWHFVDLVWVFVFTFFYLI
jgi:cytochrome c oxidase subunit 3